MSWLKTPWSVRSVVARDEREWRRANTHRKRLALTWLDREVLFAGEHPFRFALSMLWLQIAVLVLVELLPSDWFSVPWMSWGAAEQLSYFATVWTIQATLAALVYPIVIGFVAVFLQRRPAAEAFVHLYMLHSGGLAAGLSSLVLVVVMGLQYLMTISWGTTSLPAWTVVDTLWFLLNAALTTFFLYRTVDFLRPEVQERVVQRYTVSVALPRDVARLNSFQILAGAQARGWFPVPAYGDDSVPEGPRLHIGRFSFREGDVQGELRLSEPARLVSVRLWLVRVVVASWHRRAAKYPKPSAGRAFGVVPNWPLLTLPMTPGTVFEDELPLARVADGPPLRAWQRLLLRWSVTLKQVAKERYGIQVSAILDELAADARDAASRGDGERFKKAHGAFVGIHELLLGASLVRDEQGEWASWALLPDTASFFGRALHENWSESYRSIFKAAIHNMLNDTRPLQRLCHLLQQLDGEVLNSSPVEIHEHLLQLPALMMYLFGNWWVHRVEEQGVMDHGPNQMVALRPPLNRVYDEVLSSFVAGWESGRPSSVRRHRSEAEFDWRSAPRLLRLNARHIEETARMLLAAVQRGDQAAAEWLADVLGKWWGTFDYEHKPYQLFDKTDFITLDHLSLDWGALCDALGITATSDGDASTLQRGVYLAALRNFWTDVRLLSIELLLSWSASSSAQALSHSLAIEIVSGLLTGKQWKDGSEAADSFSNLSAAEYLTAKIRQFAASGEWRGGYVGRLDQFVERVKGMDRPNMVSSRVYSFSGADNVESLQDAQLVLFAVLATPNWGATRTLKRQIELWIDEQYRSIEIVRSRLSAWLQRLEGDGLTAVEVVSVLRGRARPSIDLNDAWECVKTGLVSAQQFIDGKREEALAAQPIDAERLLEIARFASAKAFSGATGEFPMQLLTVNFDIAQHQDFTLTLQKVRKGELTRVEMDQRAANESEFYEEMLARQVGVVVLTDILHKCSWREVRAADAAAYWRTLSEEAANIAARGGSPVLLLDNATRPDWVWDWQHADFGADYKRPDDLRVQRLDGHGHGYVCHFNEVAVYVAPIPPGQSILISSQAFRQVTFATYGGNDCFVRMEAAELAGNSQLVDLKFTFSRQVEVGDRDAVRLVYARKEGSGPSD